MELFSNQGTLTALAVLVTVVLSVVLRLALRRRFSINLIDEVIVIGNTIDGRRDRQTIIDRYHQELLMGLLMAVLGVLLPLATSAAFIFNGDAFIRLFAGAMLMVAVVFIAMLIKKIVWNFRTEPIKPPSIR